MSSVETRVGSEESARRLTRCRICGSSDLSCFLSLGETPLANAFLPPAATGDEPRFPLALLRCAHCGLIQLSVVVRPEILFRTYPYASSASAPLLGHFEAMARELVARFALPGSLVVEVGSNDGILLRPLAALGCRVVGIEPATNLAALANAAGLETWNEFFGEEVARRLRRERGAATVVVANNVLAHIDDLHSVARALDALLDDEGVFVAEVPYLLDLLENVEYDTVYHEHLSYFAVEPLRVLFAQFDLELFDVLRLPIHGGSMRIHVARRGHRAPSSRLEPVLDAEAAAGLGEPATYERFARRVGASRDALRALLADLRDRGKRIGGYGATAKGNTLLNYCGIGGETLEFIADSTPFKQGLLTPGTRIPVLPESAIEERQPDYALLLAWNYADAIVERSAAYVRRGGRFIHPIPLARILEP